MERFDLGFLFPNSFSSAFMMWAGGVKKRIGYKRDARSFLLTDGIERPTEDGKFKPTYMADYYLKLCTRVGCNIASTKLELFISGECEDKANALLKKYNIDNKPFILINPGASYGSSKCWSAEGFARTADLLKDASDYKIVLVCGPGETKLADDIEDLAEKSLINLSKEGFARTADLLNEVSGCSIVLVCGPSETKLADDIEGLAKKSLVNLSKEHDCAKKIMEEHCLGIGIDLDILKALIKKCSLLATVDSGPRHFAVAFSTVPVVVLMGPTDPRYTETEYEIYTSGLPKKGWVGKVIREDVDCSPCHIKTCPTDHRCMTMISPEKVVQACMDLIRIEA